MKVLKSYGYNLFHEEGSFRALSAFLKKSKYSQYFILCDENTLQHCLPILITQCSALRDAEIIEVESGEGSKSIEIASLIWQTMIDFSADKNALLINLGGGVISDLGGFTASVYKRGIAFINIPTSLLAMADASVGGKTAIDFSGIKNVVGTFAQPAAVFMNPLFLQTLEPRHRMNGLAEVFKIALIHDKKFWKQLCKEKNDSETVLKAVTIKNKIVLKDPFDKGLRKTLNFGHTIGHALESLFLAEDESLLHGEAVFIGMLVESHLALQKKYISKTEYLQIAEVLLKKIAPIQIQMPDLRQIMQLVAQDKKASGGSYNFSLLAGIGSCRTNVTVTESQIKKALQSYNDLVDAHA